MKNVIIDDVRIDENETTFNDIAAIALLNFNKQQEVQRVHQPGSAYGPEGKELELFSENVEKEKAFASNPFADCL